MRNMRELAPVKVGDELEVTIEGVGEKGDGLAKINGFVLFVPNTKQGDKVKVRVNRVLTKVGFAEVVGKTAEQASETQEAKPEESYEGHEDSEDFGEEE